MKLSVAMTTYNGSKYIVEQLQSILEQDLPIDELVVCDDCSTDNTVELICDFINKNNLNWKCIVNKSNLGYIKNFYKAISLTTGDYIFLCDQDDIWESNKSKILVESMLTYNANVMSSSFKPINAVGEFIPITEKEKRNNYNILHFEVEQNSTIKISPETYLYTNTSPGCTMCFNKSVKEEYLKYPESTIPHDWLINLIGACIGNTYFNNIPLTRYRLHDANTIGIEGRKKELKMRTNEKRIKGVEDKKNGMKFIASILDDYSVSYDRKKYLRSMDFLNNRLKFLKYPTISNWLKLLLDKKNYRKLFGKTTFWGDTLCLLRLDRLIERY